MLKNKSLSLTIAGDPYGYGHYKRMIILKSKLKKENINNRIVDISKLKINLLKKIDIKIYNIIFIDLSNDFFFKKKIFHFLIKYLDHFRGKIFIFDSVEKNIVKFIKKDIKNRFLICPYFLPLKKKLLTREFKCYYGPDYFLFDKIYFNKKKPLSIQKIFLSCGGLDEYNYTYKIAKTIFSINKKIEVHATVGPLFKKQNINLINILKKNNKFFLYKGVKNPSKISQNCDLAIVSSGLIKYEMAATKINLAVFCENFKHSRYNLAFAKSKVAYNLATFASSHLMKTKLDYLIKNYYKIFLKKNNLKKITIKNNKFHLITKDVKFNNFSQ
jgi:spore coat polysaccharide biosynthesis predicted glycosyltransferase SpsG